MQTVTVEILRPGQPLGLGLLKKTRYIVLCGSQPPVDLKIKCDQKTFEGYRELLRSVEPDGKAREKGIVFFSDLITKILNDIRPLLTEGKTDDWLHLRLVMTPRELAQLPFELALTPDGFQGQHSKWFLVNPQLPVTLTREVRQIATTRYLWPCKPRILFAWCDPERSVPHDVHYGALIEVLKNLAPPLPNNPEPVPDIAPFLTSLKHACLKSVNETVRQAIANGKPYTHIHFLAHGIKQPDNGSEVYKLLMHDNDEVNKSYYADGYELANAILETDNNKTRIPAIVSLIACDSSNEGSLSLPAGSLAHQLHESGIPCVFASQFPLSQAGSVRLVSTLYSKLLIDGEDPRKALYELRKVLFDGKAVDWASLVAYVRFPEDIGEQLKANRLKMLLEAMKTANKWADHIVRYKNEIGSDRVVEECDKVTFHLDKAINDLKVLFTSEERDEVTDYSEHFGLLGSAFKRKAEHLFREAAFGKDTKEVESKYEQATEALKESRQWYFNGYDKQKNHWNAIQYLSLTAVITGSLNDQKEKDIWTVAKILAEDDTKEGKKPMEKVWAWGTLAELYLLKPLLLPVDYACIDKEISDASEIAACYHSDIGKAKISFASHTDYDEEDIVYAKESTRRQLDRYISWWPVMITSSTNLMLKEMAKGLIKGL
jgi:hypothetical protein